MKTRTLGSNGPALSVLGMGTWVFGGGWAWGWGPQPKAESIAALHEAVASGINWIDTAPIYGFGRAEEIVGAFLKEAGRDHLFLATKCGLVWDDRRRVRKSLRPEHIRKEVEASLRRLSVDHIDLYQHHWPDPNMALRDSLGEMQRLQEEGKIRYFGVCNYGVKLLQRGLKQWAVASLQTCLNLLQNEAIESTLAVTRQEDVGFLAYSPLCSGLLTGKFAPERLAPDDWRRKPGALPDLAAERSSDYLKRATALFQDLNCTGSQAAIAWVLAQQGVTAAIIGARNPAQVRENAAAAALELTAEIAAALNSAALPPAA